LFFLLFRPPISSLFPYTTLFRSCLLHALLLPRRALVRARPRGRRLRPVPRLRAPPRPARVPDADVRRDHDHGDALAAQRAPEPAAPRAARYEGRHRLTVMEVRDLTKRFGGLGAVDHVTFQANEGEVLSIIGPNGAGKSTLFKLNTSFLPRTAGRVIFQGEDITGLSAHLVARKGVVRTFQETTIFKEMSALENVV